MKWQKGQSGNPRGRVAGTEIARTKEARELARALFDPAYWRLKFERLHSGTEHPKIEAILLAYAFGEPPKEIHASGTVVHLGPMAALQGLDEPAIETQALPTAVQDGAMGVGIGESTKTLEDSETRALALLKPN